MHESGVPLEELKQAVEEERLTLLPVEQVLQRDDKYSAIDIAREVGVDIEILRRQYQALGLPTAPDEEKVYGEEDLEGARKLKMFLDAGLPEEGVTEVARVMGENLRRIADASMELVGRALVQPGDTERDAGLRYAAVAEQLIPVMGPELQYLWRVQLRELVRNEVVSRAALAAGRIEGTAEVSVCFADLVGFTRLGEEIPPDELHGVAGRLTEFASAVVDQRQVRLVKTIGDAAMLVGRDAEAVVHTGIELVARADAADGFPRLRAGVAHGVALERAGDWYGSPVNTASRVTGVARPGSVLCTSEARKAAGDGFRWSPAGRRRLKGVGEPVRLFRARPVEPS